MRFISILLCVSGITSLAYGDAVAGLLTLNCELRDGVQHSEVTLTVDVVNQTVNGRQAHISDAFIEWDTPTSNGKKAHMLVNRLNGSLEIEIQGIKTNVQSNCTAPSQTNNSNVLPDGITLNSGRWPDGRVRVLINMKGPISDDGFLQALQRHIDLQRQIDLKQKPIVGVIINSPGGDWDASLALGRYLRKIEASVSVMGDCYSSCVLILAAGVHRSVFPYSSVGIHRPYSMDTTPRTLSETQRRYHATETKTKKYLLDMNMPEALFEAMVSVPPESIRELTTTELERFGLSQDDPAAQEVDNAKEARKYGLTMDEYLRRKARSQKVCQDPTFWILCQESVMQDITKEEYDKREARFKQCLGLGGEEEMQCYQQLPEYYFQKEIAEPSEK